MDKKIQGMKRSFMFVVLVVVCFILLSLQSASATILRYSISGVYNQYNWNSEVIDDWIDLDITGTAFIDAANVNSGNPDCTVDFNQSDCNPLYNFTYFDVYVGGEYNNFTGTEGYIKYTPSDFYGALYGEGDWSEISHTNECYNQGAPCAQFSSYEELLAFELPSIIRWGSVGFEGGIVANNPLLETSRDYFSVILERVGPASVPEPSTLLLIATGLAGLGFACRKKKQV